MSGRNLLRARSGGVSTVAAAALPAIILLVASGMTFGDAFSIRSATQNALDGAVLAGAALPEGASPGARIAAADRVFLANEVVRDNLRRCALDVDVRTGGEFTVSGVTVTGQASMCLRGGLMSAFGRESMTIAASSQATKAWSPPVCVLALDRSAPNGIEIYGNAVFEAQRCSAVANSEDGSAMRTYGGAQGRAAAFGTSGHARGEGFAPRPDEGIAPLDDPYAGLVLPAPGACEPDPGRIAQTSRDLSPGVYCGGLDIASHAVVRLQPGLYVMKDGPLSVSSGAMLSGEGVTIALVGAKAALNLQSKARVTLTSPTSGVWSGIQFYAPPTGDVEWSTISGGATLSYEGALYLPNHELWVKSPGTDMSALEARSKSYIIIAKRIWVQGNSRIDVAYDGDPRADVARFRWGARLIR